MSPIVLKKNIMEKNSIFLKASSRRRLGEFTLPGQNESVCFFIIAIVFGLRNRLFILSKNAIGCIASGFQNLYSTSGIFYYFQRYYVLSTFVLAFTQCFS